MKAQAPAQAREQHESAATRSASAREHNAQSVSVDNRLGAIAQRKLTDAMRNIPYVVAQRQQLCGMFGSAAQLKGGPDDEGLQMKADPLAAAQFEHGPAAMAASGAVQPATRGRLSASSPAQPIQMKVVSGRLNVIGEHHSDYKAGRDPEKKFLAERYGISAADYWQEQQFKGVEKTAENRPKGADPIIGHLRRQLIALIAELRNEYDVAGLLNQGISEKVLQGVEFYWKSVFGGFLSFFGPGLVDAGYKYQDDNLAVDDVDKARLKKAWPLFKTADEAISSLRELKNDQADKWFDWTRERNQKAQRESALRVRALLHRVDQTMGNVVYVIDQTDAQDKAVDLSREQSMVASADRAVAAGITGAWKVGNSHIASMQDEAGPHGGTKGATFTLTTRDELRTDIEDHEKAKAGALTIIPGQGVRDIPVEKPGRQTGAVEERNSKEYEARVQHEKDMAGGLTLIPGEAVRDVPLPPQQPRTGVVREINLPSTL